MDLNYLISKNAKKTDTNERAKSVRDPEFVVTVMKSTGKVLKGPVLVKLFVRLNRKFVSTVFVLTRFCCVWKVKIVHNWYIIHLQNIQRLSIGNRAPVLGAL